MVNNNFSFTKTSCKLRSTSALTASVVPLMEVAQNATFLICMYPNVYNIMSGSPDKTRKRLSVLVYLRHIHKLWILLDTFCNKILYESTISRYVLLNRYYESCRNRDLRSFDRQPPIKRATS